jgi:hypothetical protein
LQDRLNIPRNGIFYVCRDDNNPVDDIALAFLRVITMNAKEELDKWNDLVKTRFLFCLFCFT